MGIRLWPPARILASSPWVASSEKASSMDPARWYSKREGSMVRSPFVG